MRRRLLVGAALLLVACGSTPTATPSPTQHGGILLAGSQNPPAWPAEVGTAVPNLPDCNAPGWPHTHIDPAGPANPTKLAADSWRVVVADSVEQRPFWAVSPGGPSNVPGGWLAYTATNFRVVRVIKGEATPWLQKVQEGATQNSLPCPHYIDVIANDPPPKVKARYLLFDYNHFRLSPTRSQEDQGAQGTWWRFLVIDGVVHSEAEFDPTITAMAITPQPLDDFLRAIGL